MSVGLPVKLNITWLTTFPTNTATERLRAGGAHILSVEPELRIDEPYIWRFILNAIYGILNWRF